MIIRIIRLERLLLILSFCVYASTAAQVDLDMIYVIVFTCPILVVVVELWEVGLDWVNWVFLLVIVIAILINIVIFFGLVIMIRILEVWEHRLFEERHTRASQLIHNCLCIPEGYIIRWFCHWIRGNLLTCSLWNYFLSYYLGLLHFFIIKKCIVIIIHGPLWLLLLPCLPGFVDVTCISLA